MLISSHFFSMTVLSVALKTGMKVGRQVEKKGTRAREREDEGRKIGIKKEKRGRQGGREK